MSIQVQESAWILVRPHVERNARQACVAVAGHHRQHTHQEERHTPATLRGVDPQPDEDDDDLDDIEDTGSSIVLRLPRPLPREAFQRDDDVRQPAVGRVVNESLCVTGPGDIGVERWPLRYHLDDCWG